MTQFGTKSQNGWSTFRLEELVANPKADIVDGPFGSNLKASEYTDEGIPIARLQNVDPNTFVRKNIRFVSAQKAAELSRHNFRGGDVLITKLGDPLGEACIVPADIERGVIVADLVRVRLDPSLCVREAVCYAINSRVAQAQFKRETKGTTRPRVNLGMVRSLRLPLPERLDEQQRIVAEIEKQFTRLDAGVASLKRVQVALKRYRTSVLKAACEGRLVPTEAELARKENRSYETGAQLLQRILHCRAYSRNADAKANDGTNPSPLPSGWTWSTAGKLFDCVVPNRDKPKSFSGDIPWITLPDFSEQTTITCTKSGLGLTEVETKTYNARVIPAGSVIMSCVGRFGLAAVLSRDSVINQQLHAFLIPGFLPPEYFVYALKSQKPFMEQVATSTTIAYLNKTNCNSVPVPLPPVAEQMRIVQEVERRLSLIEELEQIVNASLQRASRLRQSVLHHVFNSHVD